MSDFFLYRTELPVHGGFDLFGFCHLAWLISIGICSWQFGKYYSLSEEKQKKKIRMIMGIVFPAMAISRDVYLMLIGHFQPKEYPLHLCNMSLWIGACYLWTSNRFVGVVYVLLCLPAASLALVFPGWSRYPFANYMHINDFVFHGLIVLLGWTLVRAKEVIPDWKELWKPGVFGLVGYIVMYQVNKLLNTNFWFINIPSHDSPLVWIYEMTGEKWYLAGHFFFCFCVVVLWRWMVGKIVKLGIIGE